MKMLARLYRYHPLRSANVAFCSLNRGETRARSSLTTAAALPLGWAEQGWGQAEQRGLTLAGLASLAVRHVVEDVLHGAAVREGAGAHLAVGLLAPLTLVSVEQQDQLLLDQLALLGVCRGPGGHGLCWDDSHLLDLGLHLGLREKRRVQRWLWAEGLSFILFKVWVSQKCSLSYKEWPWHSTQLPERWL